MPSAPTIVWFRNDLRLHDHPALTAAIQRGGPIIPVFIFDDEGEKTFPLGGASRWWLHHSLHALEATLQKLGSRLIVRSGNSHETLTRLITETGANAVHWSRRYEPASIARDASIKTALNTSGIDARSFNAALLFEPHTIRNQSGKPFQVFTPFWRHCLTLSPDAPLPAPEKNLSAPECWPQSQPLTSLELLPKLDWAKRFPETATPGEISALEKLAAFARTAAADYSQRRDLPSISGTSRLSPHLHFGEISPRKIFAELKNAAAISRDFRSDSTGVFLSEIGWREFAYHLLFHFPETPTHALRSEFRDFPWQRDAALLRAWQRGQTGYPIVDAGMRELWHTGWMHNRVRMIVASFLVKHLLQPWQDGAAWFWDTLLDADLAVNTLGWQWSAGCGADAAPYFRVFNPVLQGEKFDASGDYVRRWIPELAQLPNRYIHQPWSAPKNLLQESGISLGENYPLPIVDHADARKRALAAFAKLRTLA